MEEPKTDEQLKAEYHLMKNNLSLAMRENGVFKEENIACRADIEQLKKEIGGLKTDLAVLNQKYENDMTLMNQKYVALESQYKILEEQSNAKIQELTDLNTATLDKLAGETVRFNQELKKQKDAFTAERQALESAFAQKSKEYETRLNTVTKNLAEKETELASLNNSLIKANGLIKGLQMTVADDQTKMESMQKKMDERQATIGTMQKKMDERQTTIGTMQKTIDERQAMIGTMQKTIDERQATIGTMQKIMDERQAMIGTMQKIMDERQTTIGTMQKMIDECKASVKNPNAEAPSVPEPVQPAPKQ
jgi:chromosome segregation ATPase